MTILKLQRPQSTIPVTHGNDIKITEDTEFGLSTGHPEVLTITGSSTSDINVHSGSSSIRTIQATPDISTNERLIVNEHSNQPVKEHPRISEPSPYSQGRLSLYATSADTNRELPHVEVPNSDGKYRSSQQYIDQLTIAPRSETSGDASRYNRSESPFTSGSPQRCTPFSTPAEHSQHQQFIDKEKRHDEYQMMYRQQKLKELHARRRVDHLRYRLKSRMQREYEHETLMDDYKGFYADASDDLSRLRKSDATTEQRSPGQEEQDPERQWMYEQCERMSIYSNNCRRKRNNSAGN